MFKRLCLHVALLVCCGVIPRYLWAQQKPLVPNNGAYLGVSLGGQMRLQEFNDATGIMHSMNLQFFAFPELLTNSAVELELRSFIEESISLNAVPVLTVETFGGLESYTVDQIREFAELLAAYKTGMIVRWNHEMNGSWYPWGQQPALYKRKFREFAEIMRQFAPQVAMAWTPNQGDGYPWGGSYIGGSDPYAEFYPGDDVVDWVGYSYYHWGWNPSAPAGQRLGFNLLPWQGEWEGAIGATPGGTPDFHEIYAVQKNKPMMISETSALFRPGQPGADEVSIKKEWINQVYRLRNYPMIKAINWFNVAKFEPEVRDFVTWRITDNETLISHYATSVSDARWFKASDNVALAQRPPYLVTRGFILNLPVAYQAAGERDIQAALYYAPRSTRATSPWQWMAGSSARVFAGSGQVMLTLDIPYSAIPGDDYIVEIRTVPANGQWSSRYHYDQFPLYVAP